MLAEETPPLHPQDMFGWIMWSLGLVWLKLRLTSRDCLSRMPLRIEGKWCDVGAWRYTPGTQITLERWARRYQTHGFDHLLHISSWKQPVRERYCSSFIFLLTVLLPLSDSLMVRGVCRFHTGAGWFWVARNLRACLHHSVAPVWLWDTLAWGQTFSF